MENEFRSDLFYRLNVFPIRLPTLRARKEDIPILVRFFVQKFANRMNKHIDTISTETMTALVNWPWPGNVRELENLIERSVLLSNDSTLNVPISELTQAEERMRGDSNLENLEREHILRVLRESGGVIAGANGAAARLGMKRTTLQSRMQKMGIVREEYQN
jgi:formate hydrogenlyase transcriptional activator